MPLATGDCEVVNALRKLSKNFKLRSVVYFVDLTEAFAVQDYLVAIGIEKANSDIFVSSAVDEVLEDADILRVGCLDLEVQGVATGL